MWIMASRKILNKINFLQRDLMMVVRKAVVRSYFISFRRWVLRTS